MSFPSLCSHGDILGEMSNCLKNWLRKKRHGKGILGPRRTRLVQSPLSVWPALAVFGTALDCAGDSENENLKI